MRQEHPEDLLAAYALDALPQEERERVAAHLIDCARCRDATTRLRQVAEVLPLTVTDHAPHPDLRDRIVRAAASTQQAPPRATGQARSFAPVPRQPALFSRLNGWLVAAALMLLSLGLGAWNVSLHGQLSALQSGPTALAALAATADAPSGATGSLSLVPGGRDIVSVANLPPPSSGFVYEAWVIDVKGVAPAGTFVTTPDGHAAVALTAPVAPGDTVAITAEPAPGRPTPTGKVLLKGVSSPVKSAS
ncbi:MAG: anti-sigma factor domain-containing protein [Chloroflexota bacterium]